MLIRELEVGDIPRLIEIVKQLSPQTSSGVLSDRSVFYDLCRMQNKRVFVAVVDEDLDPLVVGTVSVLIEEKINRGTNPVTDRLYSVAHIEEVVIHSLYRGSGYGIALMKHAINYAKLAGAYKIILDCSEDNVAFYEKCGFKRHEVSMRLDI